MTIDDTFATLKYRVVRYDNRIEYLNSDGRRHREGGPAVVFISGDMEWWANGIRHRDDGPAIDSDGTKAWWVNGKLHRTDGPATEYSDGYKSWWVNSKRHRTDGPAVECPDGYKEWWVNDEELTEKEFNARTK